VIEVCLTSIYVWFSTYDTLDILHGKLEPDARDYALVAVQHAEKLENRSRANEFFRFPARDRGHRHDPKKAAAMMRQMLQWRKANGVDAIREDILQNQKFHPR